MSRVVTRGPVGTDLAVNPTTTLTFKALNFPADFREIEDAPGKVVLTDITTPLDQPSTIRVAQTSRPNVYAGTTLDPSVHLPNKKGTDTIVEVREIWSETETTDPSYQRMFPVRVAITMSLPNASQVSTADATALVLRAVAALGKAGDNNITTGITDLLHGVVKKA